MKNRGISAGSIRLSDNDAGVSTGQKTDNGQSSEVETKDQTHRRFIIELSDFCFCFWYYCLFVCIKTNKRSTRTLLKRSF